MTPQDTSVSERLDRLAQDAGESLGQTAYAKGEDARDAIADHADRHAEAARRASQSFDPSTLQAEALKAVSLQIEDVTRRLRDRPIEELVDDAAVFARRNPLLVLGGAAVLGFAAARFLKAEPPRDNRHGSNPWSSADSTAQRSPS